MRHVSLLDYIKRLNPKFQLLLSVGLAGVVFLWMPATLHGEIRLLVAWDLGILCFLILVGSTIISATPESTLIHTRLREPNTSAILALVVLTACTSVFAIGFMLTDSKTTTQPTLTIQIWLSLIAIVCSWLLTHTMFALHYARVYYNEANVLNPTEYVGGLEFPTEEPPDYLDFMYFAFTISMTSQTSDISITSRSLRRMVLLHEMVSFFFYSVIVAAAVNTVANIV